jgi:hypothetical protein
MRKLSKYARTLSLLSAMVIFQTPKSATATDVRGEPATGAKDVLVDQEIPNGFKVDRYAKVWERNPFTLMAPPGPQVQHSIFDKLFLTSWLKDGSRDVVFIQNSETNEVQKVTVEPNQDHLSLVALHLSSNPQLVEALISDGHERGSVKFRLESQSTSEQSASAPSQTKAAGAVASNPLQTVSAPQVNPSNSQSSPGPVTARNNPPLRPGSGIPRTQFGGSSKSSRRESEGVRLPRPGQPSG